MWVVATLNNNLVPKKIDQTRENFYERKGTIKAVNKKLSISV
jgi:hypothetical protein